MLIYITRCLCGVQTEQCASHFLLFAFCSEREKSKVRRRAQVAGSPPVNTTAAEVLAHASRFLSPPCCITARKTLKTALMAELGLFRDALPQTRLTFARLRQPALWRRAAGGSMPRACRAARSAPKKTRSSDEGSRGSRRAVSGRAPPGLRRSRPQAEVTARGDWRREQTVSPSCSFLRWTPVLVARSNAGSWLVGRESRQANSERLLRRRAWSVESTSCLHMHP